jgi:hypothetical protein
MSFAEGGYVAELVAGTKRQPEAFDLQEKSGFAASERGGKSQKSRQN